jgi:ribulose-phosphate 3-epimerase
MPQPLLIAPSLLSADFSRLAEEVQQIEQAGADWLHVDVMDGRFVPNITLGPLIVQAIRPHTKLPLDVHLMIVEPYNYIEAFAKAGADSISVHAEMGEPLASTIAQIQALGKKAGVVLNPGSPISLLDPVLDNVDFVLLMTVNPGFGGQAFIESVLDKITALRSVLDARGLQHIPIEVDGGINPQTAVRAFTAGASILVAGNAVFGAPDRKVAMDAIRESCQG